MLCVNVHYVEVFMYACSSQLHKLLGISRDSGKLGCTFGILKTSRLV